MNGSVKSYVNVRIYPLHKVHFDTQSYADLHKVSIEMAARELRLSLFLSIERSIKS